MNSLRIIVLILLTLMLNAIEAEAQSAKRLTKKGAALEAAAMPEEAAGFYYRALIKNRNYVDAIVGLKRTAPKQMDRTLMAFAQAYSNEDYPLAYGKYNEASHYRDQLDDVGVELEISRIYSDKYQVCLEQLAEIHYAQGVTLLEAADYPGAVAAFRQCLGYINPYKDANELVELSLDAKAASDAERYYRVGVTRMEAGDFRGAYREFEQCLRFKSPYKDAVELKNESLDKGKVRIGIFEFKNDTRAFGAEGMLYAYVVTNAVNFDSPFIEIVDRDNLERLLNEQKLGMSGVVDESTASEAGKVLGLDYVVLGRLISMTKTGGDLTSQKVTAYELYQAKSADGMVITKGKPVTYMVYEGGRTLSFEASYQMISVETSRITDSGIVNSSENDQVKYATYAGDPRKLCRINPDGSAYSQSAIQNNMVDQRLFSARQKLKSFDEMQPVIIKNLAQKISDGLCSDFK